MKKFLKCVLILMLILAIVLSKMVICDITKQYSDIISDIIMRIAELIAFNPFNPILYNPKMPIIL